MELLGIVNLPLWFIVFVAPILTIILYTAYKRSHFKRYGIKTKPSTFFLGDFGNIAKHGLKYFDLTLTRQYGKVYGSFTGNRPVLVISDADIVKEVMVKHFANFTRRSGFLGKPKDINSAVNAAEGAHWKFLRNSLSPCFTARKLRKMNANINGPLEKLHKILEEKSKENRDGFDIAPIFRAYTLDVICSVGFGMDVDSQNDPNNPFIKNALAMVTQNVWKKWPIILNTFFPDLPGLRMIETQLLPKEPFEFFQDACKALLADRKKTETGHTDLLQTMLHANKGDIEEDDETNTFKRSTQTIEEMKREGLTDHEVVVNSLIFMVAGFDTTSITLAWWAYDMAVNPDCQDTLIQEIDTHLGQGHPSYEGVTRLRYLDMVIDETLRHHPVAIAMSRRAWEDIEICGVPIPKDIGLLFPAFALHFMDEYWDEPMAYKPERFAPENRGNLHEYAYLPFGIGPRGCIGKRLGMLELKMTIVSLLQKYRVVRTDQLTVPMPGETRGMYKPAKPMHLKFVHRKQ